jgi:hypothetical protein
MCLVEINTDNSIGSVKTVFNKLFKKQRNQYDRENDLLLDGYCFVVRAKLGRLE